MSDKGFELIVDPLKAMTDEELIGVLQRGSGPVMAELALRGYRMRLDDQHSANGTPVFIVFRSPRPVGE